MHIRFVRERTITTVGAGGLSSRIFAVGELVELPEIHAQTFIADGDAVVSAPKATKVAAAVDEKLEAQPADEAQPIEELQKSKAARWGRKRG